MALGHYDKLETRTPKVREKALMAALPRLIAHARKNAPGFARILKDVKPQDIKTRKATPLPQAATTSAVTTSSAISAPQRWFFCK